MADQTGERLPWLFAATSRPTGNSSTKVRGRAEASRLGRLPALFPLPGPGGKAHQAAIPLQTHTKASDPRLTLQWPAELMELGVKRGSAVRGPLSLAGLGVGGAFLHLLSPEVQTSPLGGTRE